MAGAFSRVKHLYWDLWWRQRPEPNRSKSICLQEGAGLQPWDFEHSWKEIARERPELGWWGLGFRQGR